MVSRLIMIDNFNTIDSFLKFEEGYFYKFEALIRNTDGENPLYYEGMSNTNKNILIKSWYVDTQEYYEKIKNEMKVLCNLTGARLYITLDRKSNKCLIRELFNKINQIITGVLNGNKYGIKSLNKLISSTTSSLETSDKSNRTIMFDIDTKDQDVLDGILLYITNKKQQPYVLETKKGYHVFCYKKFNILEWEKEAIDGFIKHVGVYQVKLSRLANIEQFVKDIKQVSVIENQLGLVYYSKEINARRN